MRRHIDIDRRQFDTRIRDKIYKTRYNVKITAYGITYSKATSHITDTDTVQHAPPRAERDHESLTCLTGSGSDSSGGQRERQRERGRDSAHVRRRARQDSLFHICASLFAVCFPFSFVGIGTYADTVRLVTVLCNVMFSGTRRSLTIVHLSQGRKRRYDASAVRHGPMPMANVTN